MAELLLDNSLLNRQVTISDSVKGQLVFQAFISDGSFQIHICLIRVGTKQKRASCNQYYLLQLQIKARVIKPIPRCYISNIISILKDIPVSEELSAVFSSLPNDRLFTGHGRQQMRLARNLICILSDIDIASSHMEIKVSLSDIPMNFRLLCYYCWTSLDPRIYLQLLPLTPEQYSRVHILVGLHLFSNDEIINELFPTSFFEKDGVLYFVGSMLVSHALSVLETQIVKYSSNLSPINLVDFTVCRTGYTDGIHTDRRIYSWYTVIMPLSNCILECEFGLGCVRFIKPNNEEISRISEFTDERFLQYQAFLLVHINEYTMYKAYEKAKNQMQQSVDLLVNLLRDDNPCCNHGLVVNKISSRSLDFFDYNVELLYWVYLE